MDADCPNAPNCANCSGDHCSNSKDCQEWVKQKEISRIKFERNISFGDAKKVVEQNNSPVSNAPVQGVQEYAYSHATSKVKTISVETQSDLS